MEKRELLGGTSANEFEIIEFYIDEKGPDGEVYRGYYGMNVAKVLEIIRRPPVTEMPGDHHRAVLGTFNLRGKILPLIDLGVWLGKESGEDASLKVIVSEFCGVVCAFLVSGVTHIHRLAWDNVEAPDPCLQNFSNHSITGVVRKDDRILFILDMEQMIASMTPGRSYEDMEKAAPTDTSGAGCRVLVVDDSMAIRKLMASMLTKAGFEVCTATTGVDGLDKLEEFKKKAADGRIETVLDLVISDIEMPKMDGHTFLQRIREDAMLKPLPVILFSSHITEALRQKGKALTADDQIDKPDLASLTTRVRSLIAERWHK